MRSTRSRLSDRALRWVINAVHPDADIRSVQQLQGGVSSLVYGVSLLVDGEQMDLVLRQFNNKEWFHNEPDLVVHEVNSLHQASRIANVQTPGMVAYDETGSQCGAPAVLMTRLSGQVVLEPPEIARWLDGMAYTLAQIHAAEAGDFPWTYAPYGDASSIDAASWSKIPGKWQAAADRVSGHRPQFTKRFIHRDFHPANVLWFGGEVSGIVDWVNGCIGPAGIDVGHCRANLAQLYDVETADEFLRCYLRHAGHSADYDPYWDLATLIDFIDGPPEVYPGWTALGVTSLTTELIVDRLECYLESLLC